MSFQLASFYIILFSPHLWLANKNGINITTVYFDANLVTVLNLMIFL